MKIKIIYVILLIIIPLVVFLIKEKYLYAGVFAGIGMIIILIEKNKKIRELTEKIF